jgi:hypothetical protein
MVILKINISKETNSNVGSVTEKITHINIDLRLRLWGFCCFNNFSGSVSWA